MIFAEDVFIALNSIDFCNNWLRASPSNEPLITIDRFIFGWSIFQAAVTIYIWVFVPEKAEQE